MLPESMTAIPVSHSMLLTEVHITGIFFMHIVGKLDNQHHCDMGPHVKGYWDLLSKER